MDIGPLGVSATIKEIALISILFLSQKEKVHLRKDSRERRECRIQEILPPTDNK